MMKLFFGFDHLLGSACVAFRLSIAKFESGQTRQCELQGRRRSLTGVGKFLQALPLLRGG